MVQNILLIRLKSIGDIILTLPAVNMVRQSFPSAKITFLTSKENVVLLGGFREVNEIIALDRTAMRSGNPLKIIPLFYDLLRRLRAGKFSLVVDFQGYGETAWLTRLTGAPQRWGSVYSKGRAWAYTLRFAREEEIHPAEWNLRLLASGGVCAGKIQNEFILPDSALAEARKFFVQNHLEPGRPSLVIQPFTSTPQKNWPLDKFMAVARHWRERNVQVIFTGGPADRAALEPARQEGFIVSAGVPLLVTGGLMQLSTLIVGGDTGALHLAVAMGKRVLMIMQPTSPGSPIPFQHPEWVVAAPRPDAIAEISIAEINAALAQAFIALSNGAGC